MWGGTARFLIPVINLYRLRSGKRSMKRGGRVGLFVLESGLRQSTVSGKEKPGGKCPYAVKKDKKSQRNRKVSQPEVARKSAECSFIERNRTREGWEAEKSRRRKNGLTDESSRQRRPFQSRFPSKKGGAAKRNSRFAA